MTPVSTFNIRVYALILNAASDAILISDEFRHGMPMTKFPGGGMLVGEGTLDCLHREALEEFGEDIEITSHFYTTDFFQQAMFYTNQQLISIYYTARFKSAPVFRISSKMFDFEPEKDGGQSFRWVKIVDLHPEDITFPIDKIVAKQIRTTLLEKES